MKSEVDWTNATDFEFRQLQETKIREHYGLSQQAFCSSQALPDQSEPRVPGARYNLYDSATVAEPVDRRISHRVSRGHSGSSMDRHPHDTGADRQYPSRYNRFDAIPDNISEQELEQRTLQNFSLYKNASASSGDRFHGDRNHGDRHEDIEPWVSEGSSLQGEGRYERLGLLLYIFIF